ncbi:MAG TPA: hypothetical protein VM491_12570 [Burkholderiaceae bacterium]|jgi:hypothetical protein|nr:hypothetical protein [Burkholderiaceae bacterium]
MAASVGSSMDALVEELAEARQQEAATRDGQPSGALPGRLVRGPQRADYPKNQ